MATSTPTDEHVVWPDTHAEPKMRSLQGKIRRTFLMTFWTIIWLYGLVVLVLLAAYAVFTTLRALLTNNQQPIPTSVVVFFVSVVTYFAYHHLVLGPEKKPWNAYRAWCRQRLADYPYFRTQICIFEGHEQECLQNPRKPMVQPNQKALFAAHPHGMLCSGFTVNVAHSYRFCEADARWLVADNLFWAPFTRDYLYWGSFVSCNKKPMVDQMKRGRNLGILPGGFEEATLFEHGKHRVYIKKRFGFIKLALQHGYTVYPVYSFGEEQLYHAFPYFLKFRMLLNSFKLPGVLFFGRWLAPFMPMNEVDMVTVVGKPIVMPQTDQPTKEQVQKYHQIYVDALVDLFERNKKKYAVDPNAKLELY